MPRYSRVVIPAVPHHVTQRGNHQARVFLSRGDESAYLDLLSSQTARYGIEIVAYCLMPNHVHLVVVPSTADGLHRALKAAHGQYAQRVNRMQKRRGHLWQDRYFSSPLDGEYFLNAVRYVELNPVRASMVARAEEYRWSSAGAHCGLRSDSILSTEAMSSMLDRIACWSRWLAEGVPEESLANLRLHNRQNLPCGSTAFIEQLEKAVGRPLQYRSAGKISKRVHGNGHS